MRGTTRLPRPLHPVAWWLWASGLAVAAGATSNPVLLVALIVVAGAVVGARRPVTPWASSYGAFLRVALVVLAIRVVLYVFVGDAGGSHVLVRLPRLPLPADWGVRVGGAITEEGLVTSLEDGLRLATVLVCIGAANSLASPARLLKVMPGALYEVGVAVGVAVSFAPQAVASLGRVRRARRLRGRRDRGLAALRGMAVPVLEGALERSVDLAAAMDVRGFGRTGDVRAATRRLAAALTLAGVVAVCAGSYGLLTSGAPFLLGAPLAVGGSAVAVAGFATGSRVSRRTRYRPDPWAVPEWSVAASGAVVAAAFLVASHAGLAGMDAASNPTAVPDVPLLALLATAVALLPAVAAPPLRLYRSVASVTA
ncbi:MAG: energy-coupling factor transport system permease protein [Frankiaceae bacterium]|jgi:energy-coupling factor transport system permease protein|nr:energy-coupling factor transport system permease protein [Frankiaceae bacterium]